MLSELLGFSLCVSRQNVIINSVLFWWRFSTTTAPPTTTATTTTTATAPSATVTTVPVMLATAGYESALAPPPFRGLTDENSEGWLSRFEKYVTYRGFPDREKLNLLAVLLRDSAGDWLDTLDDRTRNDWELTRAAFRERFEDSDLLQWQKATDLWSRVQGTEESVDQYVTAMRKLARAVNVQGDQLRYAIQRGFRPQLLGHVIQTQPTKVDELVRAARVAEAAAKATATATSAEASLNQVMAELAANRLAAEQNTAELRRFTTQLSTNTVNMVGRPATPPPQRAASPRRVTFSDQRWRNNQPPSPRQQPAWRGGAANAMGRQPPPTNNQLPTRTTSCAYCGGMHPRGANFCRAAGITCFTCRRRGHLARMCRSGRRPGANFPGGSDFSA